MTIEQAIKKAIEGGWDSKAGPLFSADEFWATFMGKTEADGFDNQPTAGIFLDPSFWQSLGKAMGWEDGTEVRLQWMNDSLPLGDTHWLYQLHCFIDHLAAGKSPKDFLKQLT